MAAPSGIVWGSTVGTSPYQSRIGIYVKLTSTATETTRHTEIWFWSKYSVSDSSNTFYYDDNASSATTSKGSVSIKTTVSSGSGWSTTNQVKIASYDYTFTRGTSASTRSVAAKLTGIDIIGSTMTTTTTYTIPALASYTVKYSANGGSGAPSNQTKYYGKSLTLSSTKPTRTGYSFQGWATSASGSVAYKAGASYTANAAVTLYAVWKANTYTISYNANGGSGQPSNQTKTYGVALTLSSTKPTRTGYTFQGWATSASGSVAYTAGASYTANAAVTLYAIWKINTYTVTYNANGGTLGSVKTQTKNYGTTLKLTGTATRTDYTFKGWATSASGSVVYASGANYTANANVTLYAVWEDSYDKPTIKNCSVSRCNSSGTATDDGAYARVKFDWTSSVSNPTALIEWTETTAKSKTVTLSGTDGTVDQIIGSSFSTEKSYSIKITVDDGKDPQSTTRTLPGNAFPIDVKAGGKGTAIGKPAEFDNLFDVGWASRFAKNTYVGETKAWDDGLAGTKLSPSGGIVIQRVSGSSPYLDFRLYGTANSEETAGDYDGRIILDKDTKSFEIKGAKDVYISSSQAANASYRPYLRKGDTLTYVLRTAGYVTNGGKDVSFWIPVSAPIIGSPTVTAASISGFVLRQGAKYTHGSDADTFVNATYSVTPTIYGGIYIKAVFSDTTNVTNNDSIGIYWSGTITFT